MHKRIYCNRAERDTIKITLPAIGEEFTTNIKIKYSINHLIPVRIKPSLSRIIAMKDWRDWKRKKSETILSLV